MAPGFNTSTFITIYGRLVLERGQPIRLHRDTVYFGGIANTQEAAQQIARDIVNTTSPTAASTILPRVFQAQPGESLWVLMCRAQDWFEGKLAEMQEYEQTYGPVGRRGFY